MDPYLAKRQDMVEFQLKARGIADRRVLAAMLKVPRHLFVPEEYRGLAYDDGALPLAHGQTISQPWVVASMTELLGLKGDEKVLEIGTGSGYQAAILAELAKKVISIERVEQKGVKELLKLYKNLKLVTGDGSKGYSPEAPYDAIIVTAAAEKVPEALMRQLRTPGVMVIPVGKYEQKLLKIEKSEKGIREQFVADVRFVPLVGGEA